MAETKTKTTYNNTGGLNVRRVTAAARKKLINLDVLTNDSSTYSPYYFNVIRKPCLLYTSPSPRDGLLSRMPSSA